MEMSCCGLTVNVDTSGLDLNPDGMYGPDYSLNEQDTGRRWVDGKKIYQKTVDCGALPNSTSKLTAHGIANMDHLVHMTGMAEHPGNNFIILPHSGMPSVSNNVGMYATKTNAVTYTYANNTHYTRSYLTLWYTCTDR